MVYAASGSPAARWTCSMSAELFAQIEACLRMTVLPAMRLGAANRAT